MATIIPNNNLPESSQPWGREIQKKVETLESDLSLLKKNTDTVDSQLQSSYKRLDQTVRDIDNVTFDVDAITAIAQGAVITAEETAAGLNSLSSAGSTYTVNASNLSGGTIDPALLGGLSGLPAGGANKTFMVKLSSTNYDAGWTNIIDGGSA
jgi:predicted phage tail protein